MQNLTPIISQLQMGTYDDGGGIGGEGGKGGEGGGRNCTTKDLVPW